MSSAKNDGHRLLRHSDFAALALPDPQLHTLETQGSIERIGELDAGGGLEPIYAVADAALRQELGAALTALGRPGVELEPAAARTCLLHAMLTERGIEAAGSPAAPADAEAGELAAAGTDLSGPVEATAGSTGRRRYDLSGLEDDHRDDVRSGASPTNDALDVLFGDSPLPSTTTESPSDSPVPTRAIPAIDDATLDVAAAAAPGTAAAMGTAMASTGSPPPIAAAAAAATPVLAGADWLQLAERLERIEVALLTIAERPHAAVDITPIVTAVDTGFASLRSVLGSQLDAAPLVRQFEQLTAASIAEKAALAEVLQAQRQTMGQLASAASATAAHGPAAATTAPPRSSFGTLAAVLFLVMGWVGALWLHTGDSRMALLAFVGANAVACIAMSRRRDS